MLTVQNAQDFTLIKIANGRIVGELTRKEHEELNHAPIGFCTICNNFIYVPFSTHRYFECDALAFAIKIEKKEKTRKRKTK